MRLESERLVLREFAMEDWPAVNAYTSDPVVVQYMPFGPTTEAQTREHLSQCLATAVEQPRRIYELAVILRTEQQLIGTATIALHPHERRHASFSYLLHQQYWGKGYATEAMRTLINFGFTVLGLHRLEDTCDTRNLASARVMEKLGMRREGHLRETIWKDGRWYNEYIYAILGHEWVHHDE
ncbi:MAG TPA: GNAT family N-acetyltransferase [Anaerolineales bacterium]|nr:GNAT family N-acetyltransferase [Anaerolineales bacterium]